MRIAALIPAYRPGPPLIELVDRLCQSDLDPILIVDDGSGPAYGPVFERCRQLPRVHVLAHSSNLGKGAALKTGMRHLAGQPAGCAGVVTADADGQHRAEDVLKVAARLAAEPATFVIGAREFGPAVPLRNRAGNIITRAVLRALLGRHLTDTQSGLRGIPFDVFPALSRIPSNGYEFELDMLIALKHWSRPVAEVGIQTIYGSGLPASHFNPLLDSMRVIFVLLRFSLLSLATAALDNLVFWRLYQAGAGLLGSQTVARVAAVLFNYVLARRAVFLSQDRHRKLLPRYLVLVAASGAASYHLIGALQSALGVDVIWAKMLAESGLFALNFILQRDFVFTRPGDGEATDWDRYYRSVPWTARLTRRYTAARLVAAMRRCRPRVIVELGGANSCFLPRILDELQPRVYHVVDTSEYGLELLRRRLEPAWNVQLHRQDVFELKLDSAADTVFSVGLVEHFPPEGTRRAVLAHFSLLAPGGHAVISFPTPTLLYRAARWLTQAAGLWRFPDERPLERDEVLKATEGLAELISERVLWPLVFTQRMMVFRKLTCG